MKRIFNIMLFTLCFTSTVFSVHSYVDKSRLADGKFVKIRISETGLYYLTYDDIKQAGLTPENIRIFGYGGAILNQDFSQPKIDDLPSVPFYMAKGNDDIFNSGDYIIFYAQGSVDWQYDGTRFVHSSNCYSTYGYYFLSDNAGEPNPITLASPLSDAPSYTVSTFTAYRLHEVDSINLVDRSGKDGGGREFYEPLSKPSINYSFTFPNIIENSVVKAFIDVAAHSTTPTQFTFSCNNTNKSLSVSGIPTGDFYTKARSASATLTFNANQSEQQICTLQYAGANSAVAFLNYIEITAECALKIQSTPLSFRNIAHLGSNTTSQFELSGASTETQVWNVTNLSNIHRMPTTQLGNTLTFLGDNRHLQEYIAFNPSSKKGLHKPIIVGKVDNQNLHALQNIDMVIITHPNFLEPAKRLAAAHEQLDHLTTAVVTAEQVYNEFSSGTPDATAYRWLMKMLYDRAQTNTSIQAPQYLLLMGDGTFDNRKLLPGSGNNFLLTYQALNSLEETKAYASDDYFAFLADSEGKLDTQALMHIAVGRFPVNSLAEANEVVDKTIRFMQDAAVGKWKTNLCFLTDDGDSNEHTRIGDLAAELVRASNPDFNITKIYLDAYTQETTASGECYPLAQSQLNNMLSSGVLFFDYAGHGGFNAITSESILTLKHIREMQNAHQGLWFLATCNFSSFDAGTTSAGEVAVLNPNGGAIATISACRTVYAPQNSALNQLFCDTLFAHTNGNYQMSIGKALQYAKNKRGNDSNKMPYILLGDPAVRLHYPDDYRIFTTTQLDTLHALSIQTISGYIGNAENDTASWFNGKMSITIYDKMQQITTRDNDQTDEDRKVLFTYNDYPNTLFKGETDVKDGKFSFTFMTPKDIRYNYGNGRIAYYAYDTNTQEEAIGHYDTFLIGGSSLLEIVDTIGPELDVYLNTPSFINGNQTDENPRFFAKIHDENGINTAGSGIGHDLLLMLDNDPAQTYVLNDYFTAEHNSYQSGIASYRFTDLEEGTHSLTFRAWDLLNNSASASLNFQVVKGKAPSITSVLTYPNPVSISGNLTIVIDYDQPDKATQTTLYIYDLAGRLIHQFESNEATSFQWNLSEANVHAGVYIYKVRVQSTTAKTVTQSGKIIIIE